MGHTHVPERRNFLKLSARLAALGLTGVGLGPSRSFFVAEARGRDRSPITRRSSASTCSAATTATT